MRLLHPDGTTVHLAYCTNVHPAEDLDGVVAQLHRYAGPIRAELDVPVLGVGLWLAQPTAAALAGDAAGRRRLREELATLRLEVVTLNGFPYRSFHAPVVKRDVYQPDWSAPARADFTIDLAVVLADLLPEDVTHGSISTLPLAWRNGWTADRATACRAQLQRVAAALDDIEARTDRSIHVAVEPEPGCIVETTAQAVAVLADLAPRRVGVCLDMAHLAVQFEDPHQAVERAAAAGVPVVKSQVSCALRAAEPATGDTRRALGAFAERRFLHQTRLQTPEGVTGVDDLDEALAGGLPAAGEWRVHFHSAIHTLGEPPLATTQDVLVEGLRALVGGAHPLTTHLEVETYTWTVLPERERPGDDDALVHNLARELGWARDRLVDLGLKEER